MKSVFVEAGMPAIPVDITFDEISSLLDTIVFTYPFDDEHIGLASADNAIAEGMLPNRTLNGQIIPGPFYVLRVNDHGEVEGLTPDDISTYTEMFSVPEIFGPGQWKISSTVEDTPYAAIIKVTTAWVATPNHNHKDGEED